MLQTIFIDYFKTMKQSFTSHLFLLLMFVVPQLLLAEANYVYHEATTNNPGCGPNYRSTVTPNSSESLTLGWKIEYQGFTNATYVYYTTDGSNPSGSNGVGVGTTQVLTGSYNCNFVSGGIVDVATAVIPAQPAGTTVKYIISAKHTGGGDEIWANGPGSPCSGCGAVTNNASLATVFNYTVTASANNVEVYATGGTLYAAYTTLKGAFDAINASVHTGSINIRINANTAEGTTPATLNSSGAGAASYTAINIRPTADNVTISGSPATGLGIIQLNGADNVTIDGDNPNSAGTNRNLTITNTVAATTATTTVIRVLAHASFITSADNNTIKNCVITGSATGRNASGNTSTTGSENTTMCIYAGYGSATAPASAVSAPVAITSVSASGTGTGATINNLTIDNNAINAAARGVVFVGAAVGVSNGVNITNNLIGDQSTLSGNPPYTSPSNPSTTVYTKGIYVAGTNALTITGNSIKNILSYVLTQLNGIELNSSIGTGVININNNTIQGLVNNNGATSSPLQAILVANAAVGATVNVNNNTISNVQIAAGSGTSRPVGLAYSGAATATISGNQITNIYNRNTSTYGAYGINVTAGSNHLIFNNFIWDLNHNMSGGAAFSTLFGIMGIRIAGGTGHKIYHNSVNLYGTMLGTANSSLLSAAFAITATTITGVDVRNNIFSNTMTGGTTNIAHVSMFLPSGATAAMNLTENNNAYYCASTGEGTSAGICHLGTTYGTVNLYTSTNFVAGATTPSTNLRAYISALSAAGTNGSASYASNSVAPFISATNLHLDLAAAQLANIEQKGATGLVGVGTDIDGNDRPDAGTTIPDIGADEVALPSCTSVVPGSISPTTQAKCEGQTFVMTATGSSVGTGISYQWEVSTTSGSGFGNVIGGTGATATSYTTGALSAGTYYYRLKVICASASLTDYTNEVTITVNPIPTATASSNSPVCEGNNLNLSVTTDIGTSFAWTSTTGYTSSSQNPVITAATPINSGTYSVVVSTAAGCSATTSNVTVLVNPSPSPTPTITPNGNTVLCSGGSVELTSSYATGNIWSTTATTQTITVSTGGDYTVTITDANGCAATSTIMHVTTLAAAVVAPTNGTTYTATHECTDGTGWTYYYDNSTVGGPYLMLGVQKGSNAATFGTVPTVQVTVSGAAAGAVDLSGAPYMAGQNTSGYTVMSRYWTLEPVQEPSTDVPVRFYFQTADVNAVKTLSGNTTMTNDSMFFYKINDLNNVWNENPSSGHANVIRALTYAGNGIWPYLPGSVASNTTWKVDTLSSDNYIAEFVVGHFGGGGGGGTGNNQLPFPVELAYFNGYNQGTSNLLNWVTVSELSNKSFEIQRSTDGISYQKIGSLNTQAPNGTSTANLSYEFVDYKPEKVSYYRLKQIDIDGSANILPQVVEIALTDNFRTAIELFPNPTTSELNVVVTGGRLDTYKFEIYDIYGKLMAYKEVISNGGSTVTNMKVSDLAQGTYILTLKNNLNNIVSSQRFIKE